MLLDKIANVTPTVEAEYDSALVAAVHQAHETKEHRNATLAKVHKMLTEAGAPSDEPDGHNAFYSLIWDIERAQKDIEANWRFAARSLVNQRHPSLDLDDLSEFTTPEEFFKALHAAHGSDLGASDNDALTRRVATLLGLDERTWGHAEVSGKTLTAPNFVQIDTIWAERLTYGTVDNLREVETFFRAVMDEPAFRLGPTLDPYRGDTETSVYIGRRLAEGQEDSIISHVQLYKNGKARFTFKTAEGLRKFLRAFSAEHIMEQGA